MQAVIYFFIDIFFRENKAPVRGGGASSFFKYFFSFFGVKLYFNSSLNKWVERSFSFFDKSLLGLLLLLLLLGLLFFKNLK